MTTNNTLTKRQITLDTETTGMNQIGAHYKGHSIIEIGAVEIINRHITGNNFHVYLKPDRPVDPEAFNIHGISNEFLFDKPSFADIANEFLEYIRGAELIIHNAPFDIDFINYEFSKLSRNFPKIDTFCKVIDSLIIARKIFPGKRNNLDALCLRYEINNNRTLHGALLDAQILANVYLAMTSGQQILIFDTENKGSQYNNANIQPIVHHNNLRIISASYEELTAHENYLDLIQNKSKNCLWYTFKNKTTSNKNI